MTRTEKSREQSHNGGLVQSAESTNAVTICAGIVFVIALSVYASTLAPTVVFVDSGELIVAAKSLGVAHPPGFPLYVLLAHLATSIPIGNVAVRVNFASALFAALSIGILFLLALEALKARGLPITSRTRQRVPSKKKKPAREVEIDIVESQSYQLLSAGISALLFAFSRTLWSFAEVAEVYTLNTFLLVLVCYLVFRWRNERSHTGGRLRLLLLAAFVFGLALGVHHVSIGITLPAMILLLYRTEGAAFFKSKSVLYTALLLLLGFVLVYLYLPLAAMRSPVMNWGDPRTPERFWWHITGRQYQVFIAFSLERISGQAWEFAKLVSHEFGPVWFPGVFVLSLAGFVEMFRRDRTAFWFVALMIAGDLAYSLNYEIAEDKGAYYLPAFVALALAAAFGARFVLRLFAVPEHKLRFLLSVVLLLLVPLAGFFGNLPYTNRHNFFLARDYVNNIESTIAPGGMLLTGDWQVYSPLFYLREVEQQRRDVIAIDVGLLRRSWYYDYLERQYPALFEGNRAKVDTFLTDLRHWEKDPEIFNVNAGLSKNINDHFVDMIHSFVSTHSKTAPVYVTWDIALGLNEDVEQLTKTLNSEYQLVPEGLVFRLSPVRGFQTPSNPRMITTGLTDDKFKFEPDDVVTLKILPVYLNMLVNRGRYLTMYGKYEDAVTAYEQALALEPNYPDALKGRDEAIKALRQSLH